MTSVLSLFLDLFHSISFFVCPSVRSIGLSDSIGQARQHPTATSHRYSTAIPPLLLRYFTATSLSLSSYTRSTTIRFLHHSYSESYPAPPPAHHPAPPSVFQPDPLTDSFQFLTPIRCRPVPYATSRYRSIYDFQVLYLPAERVRSPYHQGVRTYGISDIMIRTVM